MITGLTDINDLRDRVESGMLCPFCNNESMIHHEDYIVFVCLDCGVTITDNIKDKDIVIIEDSIVRGTTSRARIKTLRSIGAKKIHMRISCPPLRFPCFYGIDFPTQKELIASKHSIEWIRDFIGADTLEYLSIEGMLKSMPLGKENFCTACFSGRYPTKLPKKLGKSILE